MRADGLGQRRHRDGALGVGQADGAPGEVHSHLVRRGQPFLPLNSRLEEIERLVRISNIAHHALHGLPAESEIGQRDPSTQPEVCPILLRALLPISPDLPLEERRVGELKVVQT
ncbi:MAG: hypothetical protein NTW03_13300, partial [Verrucomicrobia bacterium]|nr:hypothetical protein [Verrucomicrobiota bacterium]